MQVVSEESALHDDTLPEQRRSRCMHMQTRYSFETGISNSVGDLEDDA
jgi:hypothetical protein